MIALTAHSRSDLAVGRSAIDGSGDLRPSVWRRAGSGDPRPTTSGAGQWSGDPRPTTTDVYSSIAPTRYRACPRELAGSRTDWPHRHSPSPTPAPTAAERASVNSAVRSGRNT